MGGIILNFEEIKEFINLVNGSKFKEIELNDDNFKIRLSEFGSNIDKMVENTVNENFSSIKDHKIFDSKKESKNDDIDLKQKKVVINENEKFIKSPIVGCFYESSSPSKPAFVKVGDKISKGDVICIIEAMKVMNEITSSWDGEIKEIFVKNEEMVEYDQNLFKIG